jgi:hypothetical protein
MRLHSERWQWRIKTGDTLMRTDAMMRVNAVIRANAVLRVKALTVLFICLLAVGHLQAQIAGGGEIQGTISDPTGAVISGANVIAVNVATGTKTSTKSTGSGLYVLPALAPGQYTITVSAAGFQTSVQENVTVNALSVVGLNLPLKVGSSSEEVTVSSAPPELDTSTGTLGITIDNEEYTALPLAMNGGPKAPDSFIFLLPGVAPANVYGGGININGGEAYSNEIYVNGLPMTNGMAQGDNLPLDLGFAVEAVDQFQIDINGTPAMYQGQGSENFVLKSGTNTIHGNAYEYVRNTVFDAAGYFNPTVPVEKQNEFGVTLGGPILKNRLFYFGNYDGFRLRQESSYSYNSLPTTAEQSGDFSALPVPIYDPATTTCGANGVCTRQQFPGNIIPSNRLSSVSLGYQKDLPTPQNQNLQNNYLAGMQPSANQDRFVIKGDYNISQKDRIYGFADYGKFTQPTLPPGGTTLPLPYSSSTYAYEGADIDGFGFTHTFSPHLVNELNAEYNREIEGARSPTTGGGWAAKVGLTGMPAGLATDTFPPIGFGGPNAPSPWGFAGPWENLNETYGLGDTLQWSHGRHDVAVGIQLTDQQTMQPLYPSQVSQFSFGNNETAGFDSSGNLMTNTGNAYASYLLGAVDEGALTQSAVAEVGLRYRQYSFFVQDSFKIMRKLTLSLGLRNDVYMPMVEAHNQESFLNPTEPNPALGGYPGALQFAGYGPYSCQCRTPIDAHFKNYGPRFGFAYSVTPKTVVRGAFGIFYIQSGAVGGSSMELGSNQIGFLSLPFFGSPNGYSPAFNWNSGFPAYPAPPDFDPTLGTGFTTANPYGAGVIYTDDDPRRAGRPTYMENWHFTIAREILPSTVLSVSYSASASHFIATVAGIGKYSNQMLPKYLALGSLLYAPATPTNLAAAQAMFPGIELPYGNFSGTIGQMLTPFPQYAAMGDMFPLGGNGIYNSLQVSAQRKIAHGLSFLISYTLSKEIDDGGSNNILAAGGALAWGRTAYNARLERAVGVQNMPNNLSLSYDYNLPFGTGHRIGNGSPFARALASGWALAGIQTYDEGIPLANFGASCLAPYTGQCFPSYNPNFSGPVRINGKYGSGDVKGSTPPSFINVNAFMNPADYTFGNIPRTQPYNLHTPFLLDEDFSLTRDFKVWERTTLQLRAEAFNTFNRVQFGGIGTNISSSNFGTVGGQGNSPRKLQFEAKVSF